MTPIKAILRPIPGISASHIDVIARLDRAIQYARSVFTGSPGQAGR
jgi:hypothetical protein